MHQHLKWTAIKTNGDENGAIQFTIFVPLLGLNIETMNCPIINYIYFYKQLLVYIIINIQIFKTPNKYYS